MTVKDVSVSDKSQAGGRRCIKTGTVQLEDTHFSHISPVNKDELVMLT